MIGLKLSWRYFRSRRISILAVASVALCVFIVVVVMSVMNGLVNEFKEKNHIHVGDCVITTSSLTGFPYAKDFIEELNQQKYVFAASETVKGVGLMTSPGAPWNMGIEFVGFDPASHSRVTHFAETLRYHTNNPAQAFIPPYDIQKEGCVLGIDLILNRTSTGQYMHPAQPWPLQVTISGFPLNPKGALARAGVDMVSTKTFYYSDHSHSGLVRPDGRTVYLPLEQARLLCGMDAPVERSSEIHIRFAKGVSVETGTEQIRKLWQTFVQSCQTKPYSEMLKDVQVLTWQQDRREFIATMEVEQMMLTMLFLMLGIVTVFIIFVVFYMVIGYKTRDLGVLKSVGMPSRSVASVFLGFAAMVGLTGSFLGITCGCLFLWKINDMENWLYNHYGWQVWDKAIYAIDKIPNAIEWPVLISVALFAVAACLLGAAVPSIQAAVRSPVKVLQTSQI